MTSADGPCNLDVARYLFWHPGKITTHTFLSMFPHPHDIVSLQPQLGKMQPVLLAAAAA